MTDALSTTELARMDAYWRAANYLTVGQIYLLDNPLLREPLKPEHIKPRLLGHWGTSPGQTLLYVHLNRLVTKYGADVIYLSGPGHGGPAIVAHVYLEGTYSEIYPEVSQDEEGLRRLFRQFSTPGGIPSHVSVTTPGSIHEGGELGYVLVHAFGAAFDNPGLIVAAVIGDGEAETGPLEGGWKGISFLNPARDGAVLPILHLNGYKISGPTVLGRSTDEEIRQLIAGHGYEVFFVEGDEPLRVHQALAATLDTCYARIREIQTTARIRGVHGRPRWPALVLRTPEGLDRAESRRRTARGGDLPCPPGAGRRGQGQPRAPRDPGGLDAELPAPGALRCHRPARSPSWRPWPPRGTTAWVRTRTPMVARSSWSSICRTTATTRSR